MSRHASPVGLGILVFGLCLAPAASARSSEPDATAAGERPPASAPSTAPSTAADADGAAPAGRAAHEAGVRRLLRAMGQEAVAERVLRRTVDGLRQSLPQVPAAFWTAFEDGIDPAELVELQVPVYADALTPEDVEGLIAFYESPLGRRFAAAQAPIADGLQAAGERWGQALARRALQALEAEGD